MTLGPAARRFVLTAHVSTSVGWLGAVMVFLAVSAVALTTTDPLQARGAYLVMESIAWLVLVPLALASFATGVVQAMGTRWGLFRHYWVIVKLALTIVATAVLLLYTQTLASFGDMAASNASLGELQNPSPVLHATVGAVLLLIATVLAIYKPRGTIRPIPRRR
jgi:hypothetical protein